MEDFNESLPRRQPHLAHFEAPSPSSSLWTGILSASSSSEAIILASKYHVSQLSAAVLPQPLESFSASAYENVVAVRRAFGVEVPGLTETGWELWGDDKAPSIERVQPKSFTAQGSLSIQSSRPAKTTTPAPAPAPASAPWPVPPSANARSTAENKEVSPTQQSSQSDERAPKNRATMDPTLSQAPSPEDIKHANALRSWACTRAHAAPPSVSVTYLCRARTLPALLPKILTLSSSSPSSSTSSTFGSTPVSAIAAVLQALSGGGSASGVAGENEDAENSLSLGSANAEALYTQIVIPYLRNLRAPASRDMLQSIIHLCSQYWRPAVPVLYKPFSVPKTTGSGLVLNAPIAELLSRVTQSALPPHAAASALAVFCSSDANLWPDFAVPLIQSLFTRASTASSTAKIDGANGNVIAANSVAYHSAPSAGTLPPNQQDSVVDVLVPALARNASALEKSVRFGKLLFTLVKDVPDIKLRHQTSMETVCSRSTVFLAKRALTLLRQPRKPMAPGGGNN